MKGEPLFKPRHAHTLDFQLSAGERELYDAVTDFVSTKLAEIRIHSAAKVGYAGALQIAPPRRQYDTGLAALLIRVCYEGVDVPPRRRL